MPQLDRPVILITCDVQAIDGQPTETLLRLRLNYARAVVKAGGVPLILPPVSDMLGAALDMCNGVLLSGSDAGVVVPSLRETHETTLIAEAIARGLPVLGICHGMQALGQFLGGELLRDDPDLLSPHSAHMPNPVPVEAAHSVSFSVGSLLASVTGGTEERVNSLHRHALRRVGACRICATASDGVIEAIESDATPFCLGVQWHPEYLLTETDARLLRGFVDAAIRHRTGTCRD